LIDIHMPKKRSISIRMILIVFITVSLAYYLAVYFAMSRYWQLYVANKYMWTAVENGNTTAVLKAFSKGADPNDSGDAGMDEPHTLVTAMNNHDTHMVRFLMAHGANPNIALENVYYLPDAENMIHLGANVNAVKDGWSVLEIHSANGEADIVRVLLAHGADPNFKDGEGKTVLDRTYDGASKAYPTQKAPYSNVIAQLQHAGARTSKSP
jgi:hypothetical protein